MEDHRRRRNFEEVVCSQKADKTCSFAHHPTNDERIRKAWGNWSSSTWIASMDKGSPPIALLLSSLPN